MSSRRVVLLSLVALCLLTPAYVMAQRQVGDRTPTAEIDEFPREISLGAAGRRGGEDSTMMGVGGVPLPAPGDDDLPDERVGLPTICDILPELCEQPGVPLGSDPAISVSCETGPASDAPPEQFVEPPDIERTGPATFLCYQEGMAQHGYLNIQNRPEHGVRYPFLMSVSVHGHPPEDIYWVGCNGAGPGVEGNVCRLDRRPIWRADWHEQGEVTDYTIRASLREPGSHRVLHEVVVIFRFAPCGVAGYDTSYC